MTLSEHLLGCDLGIDQLLAAEAQGGVVTAGSNRIGLQGSTSLALMGAGLVALARGRRGSSYFGLAVCLIDLVPLVGFAYHIEGFYDRSRPTVISGPTVIALIVLGTGLALARPAHGPMVVLWRKDAGGRLFRQWLPLVVLVPLAVGFLAAQGWHRGFYDPEFGAGMLVLALVVIFTGLLWQSAARLSMLERAERRTKEELSELSQRLSYHVTHSPLAVIEWGPEMRLTRWSKEAERIFGWRAEEVLGKRMEDFRWSYDEDRPRVSKVSGNLQIGTDPKRFSANRNYRKDGTIVHCEWYSSSLHDEGGKLRSILSLVLDVTERNRAEAALRRSEERYRTLFDTLIEGFCTVEILFDADGRPVDYRFLEVNPAFEKHTGLHQAQGKSMRDLAPDHEALWVEILGKVALTGEAAHFESEAKARGCHYDLCAYRVDGPESRKVAILLNDVTGRKREQETRARLAAIVESSEDAIIGKDLDGMITSWNAGAEHLLGYRADEVIGQPIKRIIPPELQAEEAAILARVRRGESVAHLETARLTRDGRLIPASMSISPIRDAAGAIIGVSKILRDITARKEAEESLRESERLYRAIGESIDYGIWICDAAGRNTYASESFLKLVGMTQEECSRFGWADVLHPEDAEATIAAWKYCVEKGGPWYREHRYRGCDGQWHPILACGVAVRDERGRITRWAGINLDISRLKRAEETLRESERQFRMLADSIPNLAWWADGDGYITWYNQRWYEYTGTIPEQMEGWGWQSVHHPEMLTKVLARWKASIASGEPFEMDFPLRGADGRYRWFLTRIIPLRDAAGKAVRWFGTNTDVTEKREAEEVLERGKEKLEGLVAERTAKLQELVGELEHFSYTITHDMRAPLRAMRGFAEVVEELCAQCPGEQQKIFLRRIITAAERMDLLITDALNYSKAVRQELPLAPVDVGRLLRGMLDSYPEFQSSQAEITVEREMPLVLGNEAALTQCFSNLLGNAVKFAQPGRRAEVRVLSELKDGWVRLWVEDNGIGISASMMPRVFDMFSRRQGAQAGTGIGLALVRKVADRMGGRVGVESEPGKGSRFWVELRPGDARRAPHGPGDMAEPA